MSQIKETNQKETRLDWAGDGVVIRNADMEFTSAANHPELYDIEDGQKLYDYLYNNMYSAAFDCLAVLFARYYEKDKYRMHIPEAHLDKKKTP